ncbi:MAG: hypothetical protein COX39_00720 [Candidatus Nealsonbacteria bacterium CG23_combo_of_CG06-09_8_20_14_all_40_13]|uniref:Rad50/SbcC-type AAA domain-containing protein n=1 Tax=Candidatus Nealsonbacteria bacterium CG23_combo_of_CG06-09_8_20_14_all_40_13 TaxID=1974724 RepID=A0A2G9YRJ8_9BACT|nr:MAG: hypothetical protein COX39_00720 [Candidatus Nealsonbacteria bacterium CG23_combo_of_CG06-09_8_20_14_all_40_13]PIR70985.1 MAG: hypothetical protein COU44_02105 [Candidatus Nealsonbacteria bacterium CG10_big_fil_rev_8_21_14_0_10_40_24]
MNPIKLQLANFMSYKNPQILDFSRFEIGCLTGTNGVGKSSILEAITWALWGRARGEKMSDEIIHQGEQGMWVEVVLQLEDKYFRVLRKRERKGKSGKTTLYFGISKDLKGLWQNITEEEIAKTQKKIEDNLHLTYEIFTNSAYLRQGHADEFTVKTPTERKQILSDILGLDIFAKLEEKAKEKNKEISEKENEISFQIASWQKEIAENENLENAFNKMQLEKNKIEKELDKIEAQLDKSRKEISHLDNLRDKLSTARENFRQLNDKLKDKLQEKKDLKSEELKVKLILKNREKILDKFREYEKQILDEQKLNEKFLKSQPFKEQLIKMIVYRDKLKDEIWKISGISICPTCKRPLPEKDARSVIIHLEEDFKNKFGRQIIDINNKLKVINYNSVRHQSLKKNIAASQNMVQEKNKLDLAENNLKHLQNRIEQIKKEISQAFSNRNEISIEGSNLAKILEKSKTKVSDFQILEEKVKTKRIDFNNLIIQYGAAGEKLAQIKNLKEKIKQYEVELKQLNQQKTIFDKLTELFSKKGVPSLIIEKTLPALEEEANIILSRVSSGNMKVAFKMERPKKNGNEIIDTLDIIIFDALGSRPYELFSGGEAFRINFAIRVALSKFLAQKAKAKVKFLVIDEGFGNLDTAGLQDIILAINSVKTDFDKILVITHLEELKNAFESQILVTKDEEGSHITMVD